MRLKDYRLLCVAAIALAVSISQAPAGTPQQKVDGFGGFFFRAHDPDKLAQWYQDHLGITTIPTSYGQKPWRQSEGPTAFAPFPQSSKYFDPGKPFELNFRLHDLDKMVAQLKADGIEVKVDPTTYPNGRFAHLADPEGNPIELWQPMTPPSGSK